MTDYPKFRSIPRWNRTFTISEKIDGTNGLIHISDDGLIQVGSRNRWLSADSDNFGFHKWVMDNHDELSALGSGYHYGEWYGAGIQRTYGLKEKRFALFNTHKWNDDTKPACCDVVPTLAIATGDRLGAAINATMAQLQESGSMIAPFGNPEGVIIYSHEAGIYFKKTFEKDDGKWNGR